MAGKHTLRPPSSCAGCFSWGCLPLRSYCGACQSFGVTHEPGQCAACRRVVPLKKGYCRLCWMQASLEAKGQVTVLEPFLREIRHHQLSFAGMQRWGTRVPGHPIGKQGRRAGRPQAHPPQPRPVTGWIQLQLFDARRDYRRFDRRRHADFANPWLARARTAARTIGEARGWSRRVAGEVDRGLVILLSGHAGGDKIRYSELFPALRAYGISAERTVEVLGELGLFHDDRVPAFETWLERSIAGLAPGIRADVEHWLRTLRHGGPRSRPRAPETAWTYLRTAGPALAAWSDRYDHLREVTREDILAAIGGLTGHERHHTLSVIRSLFRHCKKNRTIFRDPAARLRVGEHPRNIILPLRDDDIDQAVTAARNPRDRLVLALAAIHAARPKAIRELQLDDINPGNRRLTIAGRTRPLDDLTRQVILDWLSHRRTRWPDTANPHLIINQQTAMETGPVSKVWLTESFRGQAATLERLRVHRQLDEALTHGPDPLHLASVFGLDPKTAIRYAENARQLLTTAAEEHAPGDVGSAVWEARQGEDLMLDR
jgi:site-specific recombinase XerD